jgi:predicted MFS family arabinose efflux permease
MSAERPTLFTGVFARLMAMQVCYGAALASFVLLPKFLAQGLGAGPDEIGRVMSAFSLANVVFVPLVGVGVDRLGRRAFLLGGSALMVVAALGFPLLDSVGVPLYALRALQGASFACVYIAASTLVVDSAPPQRLSEALALFGATLHVMNASVPWAVERASERFGWDGVFACAAVAAALGGLLAVSVRSRSGAGDHAGPAGPGLAEVLRRAPMLRAMLVMILVGVAVATLSTYIQPYALERGLPRVANFFLAFSLAALLARVLLGSWMDRSDRHLQCAGAVATYALVLLATPGLTAARLPLLGAAFGFAHGIFMPNFSAMNLQGAAAGERGKIVAAISGGFNVGLGGGTFALGLVASAAGYASSFRVAAGAAAAALLLLLLVRGPARWSAGTGRADEIVG